MSCLKTSLLSQLLIKSSSTLLGQKLGNFWQQLDDWNSEHDACELYRAPPPLSLSPPSPIFCRITLLCSSTSHCVPEVSRDIPESSCFPDKFEFFFRSLVFPQYSILKLKPSLQHTEGVYHVVDLDVDGIILHRILNKL